LISLPADHTGALCRFGHLVCRSGSTITAFFLDRIGSLPVVSAGNLTEARVSVILVLESCSDLAAPRLPALLRDLLEESACETACR